MKTQIAICCVLAACSSAKDETSESPANDLAVAGSAAPVQPPTGISVSGPVTGGKGAAFSASTINLDEYGYTESEFFFEGTATSYAIPSGMSMDGKWTLSEANKAAFKSRLVVRRPKDASKFNGTVVVEWLNVSGGVDSDPGFMYNLDLLVREGYAWVGVTAQIVGVEGGGFSLSSIAGGPEVKPLKQYDPARYGTLEHPGDAYS